MTEIVIVDIYLVLNEVTVHDHLSVGCYTTRIRPRSAA